MQSIEEFMKEQEEIEANRVLDPAYNLAASSIKMQRKASMQAEQARFEAEKKQKKAAVEAEQKTLEEQEGDLVREIGLQNWVGKLLG